MIELAEYIAKGFPGRIDEALQNVGVAGIDREQTLGQIRLSAETEGFLYGPNYSPTRIRYVKGSRPELERIVAGFKGGNSRDLSEEALRWTPENVIHPFLIANTPSDRAMTEEQLIESGVGWCNEQARVFIALCQVMEIPARVCFVYHTNTICGHTTAEAFVDGKWSFFDPTFAVNVPLPDGKLASAAEISSGLHKQFADQAYKQPMEDYFSKCLPFVEDVPGWRSSERVSPESGGELLAYIGLINYIIDGVDPV